MTKRIPPYSPEVRERAVRMVFDHQGEHGSQWAAIQSIAAKIGCSGGASQGPRPAEQAGVARGGEALRNWVRQFEREVGACACFDTAPSGRLGMRGVGDRA